MWKFIVTLSVLASVENICLGSPDESEDVSLLGNATIYQVAFDPLNDPLSGLKEYSIISSEEVNWYTALQLCSAQGLSLASVNSAEESSSLQRYIFDAGYYGESFWLSGNNLGDRRKFHWLSNGRSFFYTNWARNEPNNAGGQENCVELVTRSNGRWNDANCYLQHYFVCENRCSQ